MGRQHKMFSFLKSYESLADVLADHKLASLGDSYVNFVYSLALSNRLGKPAGVKVKGSALAEALRRAGLREQLPSRMTKHTLADAVEALIVYAWLNDYITLADSVTLLGKSEDVIEGFSQLLALIRDRAIFP